MDFTSEERVFLMWQPEKREKALKNSLWFVMVKVRVTMKAEPKWQQIRLERDVKTRF